MKHSNAAVNRPLGHHTLHGEDGTPYLFTVYPIDARPAVGRGLYTFGRPRPPVPAYIGKSDDPSGRIDGHEHLAEAKAQGATLLLIYECSPAEWAHVADIEESLIKRYAGPHLINTQHNALAQIAYQGNVSPPRRLSQRLLSGGQQPARLLSDFAGPAGNLPPSRLLAALQSPPPPATPVDIVEALARVTSVPSIPTVPSVPAMPFGLGGTFTPWRFGG